MQFTSSVGWEVFTSVEQLRTWTSNTGIWVLQREAKTQDVVEGFVAEMPHRILLSYTKRQPSDRNVSGRRQELFLWRDTVCRADLLMNANVNQAPSKIERKGIFQILCIWSWLGWKADIPTSLFLKYPTKFSLQSQSHYFPAQNPPVAPHYLSGECRHLGCTCKVLNFMELLHQYCLQLFPCTTLGCSIIQLFGMSLLFYTFSQSIPSLETSSLQLCTSYS